MTFEVIWPRDGDSSSNRKQRIMACDRGEGAITAFVIASLPMGIAWTTVMMMIINNGAGDYNSMRSGQYPNFIH